MLRANIVENAGSPKDAFGAKPPDAANGGELSGRDEAGEVHGWDSVAQWTGGLRPEEIEALRGVRESELLPTVAGVRYALQIGVAAATGARAAR